MDPVDEAMKRHPAGKALVPCPACDGKGRLTKALASSLVAALVGRMTPGPVVAPR